MSIYTYQDYKKFVNDWIETQARGGHGQLRQLSDHLRVSSVIMSQVFRGNRDLSLEQAVGVTSFLGLNENETNYFLLLVQVARAGTEELRSIYKKQLDDLKTQASSLKNRIKHSEMSLENRATFYSHWYYSAIRLGVSIKGLGNTPAIADYLQLDRKLVTSVIDFLRTNGLIVEKNGSLDLGPSVTHVGHDSPFVGRHQMNWRTQAFQYLEAPPKANNLFYSGPMALSDKASQEIRSYLVDAIEKSTEKAASSKSETLRCLNIDWFGLERR